MCYNSFCCVPIRFRLEVINMPVKLTDLDIDNIVNEYTSGLSARNIAAKYGVTHSGITYVLRKRGVRVRGKAEQGQIGALISHAEEIESLYAAGEHPEYIGNKFNCSAVSVYKILKSVGAKLRKGANVPAVDIIVEEYKSGMTAAQIAVKHGAGSSSIHRRLKAAGVEANNYGPVISLETAVDLFNEGIGIAGVAKKVGCSSTYLVKLFSDNGIQARNRSEQQFARMARATSDERKKLSQAAHDAVRGVKRSRAELLKRAKARSKIISGYEIQLRDMLSERGITTDPQFPIGTYNCDLAAYPVAVEVFGGKWHWHGHHLARTEERFRHILNAGWHILVVAVDVASPLTPAVADYVAAYIEQARRDPSARREYRVIWRAGEDTTAGSLDDDHISIIPPFTNRRNPATGRYERVAR